MVEPAASPLSLSWFETDATVSWSTAKLTSGVASSPSARADTRVCWYRTELPHVMLSPDAAPDHWDVIEGQGSLFHPAYAAVTLGLLHGSQPDAMVLCHTIGRTAIDEYEGYPVPDLRECMAQYEQAARVTNAQARVAGISLNTQGCGDASSLSACNEISSLTGVPCIDPMRHALDSILDALPG